MPTNAYIRLHKTTQDYIDKHQARPKQHNAPMKIDRVQTFQISGLSSHAGAEERWIVQLDIYF